MKTGIEKHDERSAQSCEHVHADLVKVFELAADKLNAEGDIQVVGIEGARSLKRQKMLFAKGATKTLKSRHLIQGDDAKAKALDIVPVLDGVIAWDWPLFDLIASAMKDAAKEVTAFDGQLVGDGLEWGGDWRSFKDGPHWQLNSKRWP